MTEYDISDVIKILEAASELSIQELINYLQSFMIENQTKWMEENFSLIYQTIFKHDSFLELQKFCTDLIIDEPEKIFKSLDFISIPEKALVSLIQNDNLQANEVQVWENVLKWGLAQNPELPSDLATFSKDDFNTLKNTLQQCIPFIRLYNLTFKEFREKVMPYKKVLPKELYKDLLNTFLDPDSKSSDKSKPRKPRIAKEINLETADSPRLTKEISLESVDSPPMIKEILKTVDSRIITYQHAELFSKWIDKLEITDKLKNSYEFKLLLRGTRDGYWMDCISKIP